MMLKNLLKPKRWRECEKQPPHHTHAPLPTVTLQHRLSLATCCQAGPVAVGAIPMYTNCVPDLTLQQENCVWLGPCFPTADKPCTWLDPFFVTSNAKTTVSSPTYLVFLPYNLQGKIQNKDLASGKLWLTITPKLILVNECWTLNRLKLFLDFYKRKLT